MTLVRLYLKFQMEYTNDDLCFKLSERLTRASDRLRSASEELKIVLPKRCGVIRATL